MIKLSLNEIKSEKLETYQLFKIFFYSLILIPVAFTTHIFTSIFSIFTIPNTVIDIITLAEKTKKITRRKSNEQIKT